MIHCGIVIIITHCLFNLSQKIRNFSGIGIAKYYYTISLVLIKTE